MLSSDSDNSIDQESPNYLPNCLSTVGAVQGIITGIRGLCNGLGPALFGLMFFIFHVDLDSPKPGTSVKTNITSSKTSSKDPSLRVSSVLF